MLQQWSGVENLSPGENLTTILGLSCAAWSELYGAIPALDNFAFSSDCVACLFLIRNWIVQRYDLIKSFLFSFKNTAEFYCTWKKQLSVNAF